MLKGLMAVNYTEQEHDTPNIAETKRDYDAIYKAGQIATQAVFDEDINQLAQAVKISYQVQMDEGMEPLIDNDKCLACKYCGGGWGGYAVYLFSSLEQRDNFVSNRPLAKAIEPYIKPV